MIERSREWTEADLLRLIATQVPENIALEYKGAAAIGAQDREKREIAKDVSAFANSAGGVLVYGMAEDGHNPTQIEPVNPNPFSKEWLENVIISNVQPRIDGLHINPVQLAGTNAGQFAYVVTVPQSLTAHQAADHRYYKRFNFQAVPMEHYEVQDAMNRAKTPIIEVQIERRVESRTADLLRFSLLTRLENKGARAAQFLKILVRLPEELNAAVSLFRSSLKDTRGLHGEPYREREFQLTTAKVIFPQDSYDLEIAGQGILVELDRRRHEFIQRVRPTMNWIVYADDMVPRTGYKSLHDFDDF